MKRPLLLILLATAPIGCSGSRYPDDKVPRVAWRSKADALKILRDRFASIRSVSANGTITLTRPDGESVRLDLAMVSAPPDKLRLRAWKLGRAVFDLTMTPDGLWLLWPEDPGLKEKARTGGLSAARLARSWKLFNGEFFNRSDLDMQDAYKVHYFIATIDGQEVFSDVMTRSLIPWVYTIKDAQGIQRFSLVLMDYGMVNGVAFPFRYEARSESGALRIDLREVELNTDLPVDAFVPPRRAQRLP